MKTIKFSMEIGVVSGYGHNNADAANITIDTIGQYWQEEARSVFAACGTYISAVVSGANRTVYNTDWGCPIGGEVTFAISGSANPNFVTDMDAWKDAVLTVAKAMKSRLQQSTVTVEFVEVEMEYLN